MFVMYYNKLEGIFVHFTLKYNFLVSLQIMVICKRLSSRTNICTLYRVIINNLTFCNSLQILYQLTNDTYVK